ncbi:MAG TPA: sigma-70 family RNA polymerase sigma factor [Burkholderiales bacterium]|jgi:RNA polymerase sigma factor, sigma-70 family
MTPSQSEALQHLLLACARQDREAFALLYRTTSPKLYGIALRILKRADWAEEILQECYVSIWTHAGTYAAGRAAPMTWMTSIVRNRCLDALRRPSLEVVLQATEPDGANPLDGFASDRPDPLDQLAQASDARALRGCLEALEARQRQAILLAFYEGLTHTELALQLRQPLGTVKTWVRRGLERLKGCLAQANGRAQ